MQADFARGALLAPSERGTVRTHGPPTAKRIGGARSE